MTVYMGIDWSQSKHDVVLLNEAAAVIAQLTIAHDRDGFLQLDQVHRRWQIPPEQCVVALETSRNMLIDFLWSRGYSQVYVVPPNMVKSNRSRYRQSGARTDRSDAFVLADLLRTDRGRLQPWQPDTLLTRQIRSKVSLIYFLTRDIIRTSNRLRALLGRYYPAALEVFGLLTQVGTRFIQAYPTPGAAAALTFAQFADFARQYGYPWSKKLPGYFARLQAAHPEAAPETVLVYQHEATVLAGLLREMLEAKAQALRQLQKLFGQHPDYPIFSSLPAAGKLLGPALLAKFGDHRQRFPTPSVVQALAGTCPVTDESGKRRIIRFRRACDRDFRRIAQQWARASLKQSVWANGYWSQVRPRCASDSHAYRCLANRWLAILWTLWQKRQPYDEAYHLRQRALRSKAHNQRRTL
jgi:transposase